MGSPCNRRRVSSRDARLLAPDVAEHIPVIVLAFVLAGAALGGLVGYGLGRWSSPSCWSPYYYAPQHYYVPYQPNYYPYYYPYYYPAYAYPSYPSPHGWYPGYGYGYGYW